MTDHVILLHGLWMRGFALAVLDRRLMEEGFQVHRFDYLSVGSTQESVLDRLRARMREWSDETQTVHLVGHSLGGLLALRACSGTDALPQGRIVCLGSPLLGSAAARAFAGWGRGGEALLGHNRQLLEQGFDRWDGPREVGMVAGSVPLGLGSVIGHFEGEHDGTVSVAETRLPGLTDHCVVESNHTSLLFSVDVARLSAEFLNHGRFVPAGA